MKLSNVLAMTHARTMEFVRDRGTFFWNLVFPLFLVFGFAFAFSGEGEAVLTIGVWNGGEHTGEEPPYLDLPGVEYVEYDDRATAVDRVATHRIDLLIDLAAGRYLINETSRSGALAATLLTSTGGEALTREAVAGEPIRFIDFFVPGVIGMNMMFSSLFGVGFIVVRYRKNGVLKRLKATPLSSLEFVSAQMISRVAIVIVTSVVVFVGADLFLNFMMRGSHLLLLLVLVLGIVTLVSLGLVFASRIRTEELANGVINIALWPMIAFSGVFFSLENAPVVLRRVSRAFPLTHFLDATRAVMLEGAGFVEILPNLLALATMTVVFLLVAAALFRWE